MIKSFADRRTEQLYRTGHALGVPPDVRRRALRKLDLLHVAVKLSDLREPPGNRLHALKGDRAGQHAIAVTTSGGSASGSLIVMRSKSSSATTTRSRAS